MNVYVAVPVVVSPGDSSVSVRLIDPSTSSTTVTPLSVTFPVFSTVNVYVISSPIEALVVLASFVRSIAGSLIGMT